MKIYRILDIFVLISISIALYMVFIYAPSENIMGIVQKIFYFHVSSAWIALLGFSVTFICSILYLYTNKPIFDYVAYSSVEVSLIFCTIVLITGPIWAKPIWFVWWTWDPRLTTTLILWFIYVGYTMLRRFVEDESKKARFSAALGIIGFLDVPIVFFSIKWWRTIHPNVIQKGGGGIAPEMMNTLLLSMIAFSLLYLSFIIKRVRIELIEKDLKILKKSFM